MQEHPLALFWLFPRPDSRPDVDARQANCLVRYSSELEDAGSNDMMIASVPAAAGPAGRHSVAHLAMERESGTWGGAGGGRRPAAPGSCACGRTSSGGGVAGPDVARPRCRAADRAAAPRRRRRHAAHARRRQAMPAAGGHGRVRCGLPACRHRPDRHRSRDAVRRRGDRRLVDGDDRRHRSHLRHLPYGRVRRSADRRGPARSRARRRWPLGGRRLGVPGGPAREHEPADDRSRRAAVGPHPGVPAAAGAATEVSPPRDGHACAPTG